MRSTNPPSAPGVIRMTTPRKWNLPPERKLSITIGTMLGLIHTLILWASYQSLPTASYLLYGNPHILPLAMTGIVDLAMVLCVLVANWLVPVTERLMVALVELIKQIFPPEPEEP